MTGRGNDWNKKRISSAHHTVLKLLVTMKRRLLSHPHLATLGGTAILFIVGSVHFHLRESSDLMRAGNILLGGDRSGGAATAIDPALRKHPAFINARMARALAYERIGNPLQAIADYREILLVCPGQTGALKHLGWLSMRMSDLSTAIGCFEQLVSSSQADSMDVLHLSVDLAADKQHARALGYFNCFLTAHPDNALVRAARDYSLAMVPRADIDIQKS